MREPREPVGEDRLVDRLLEAPARLGVGHREHQPVAEAAAEVEAGLGLDRHRQALGEIRDRPRREQLAAERPDRQLDPERGAELARPRPAGDHDGVRAGEQLLGRRALAHLDAEPGRSPDELARHRGRIGDAVLAPEDGAEHVVDAKTRNDRRVDALDSDPERALVLVALLDDRQALLGGREEEVADLLEQRLAELLEERDALPREPHLVAGRELLADAAHRLRGRSARDLAAVAEDDVAGAEQREVVRDAGPGRACSRDEDHT